MVQGSKSIESKKDRKEEDRKTKIGTKD